MSSEGAGIECFWGNLKEHPQCPHGPTLLFGRRVDGELKQYYACSACRDRKMCNFYLEKDGKLTKIQKSTWQEAVKKFSQRYHHRKSFLKLNEIMSERPDNRRYCHTCERLFFVSETEKHEDHEIMIGVTDEQLMFPTKILKPLSNPKKEAQYMFLDKSTIEITNLLIDAGAKNVLCIGTPRIHEYISHHYEGKMTSLLLDFDGRYHNFFGPLSFCWYNLFNHHFFTEEAREVFKDFLTQDNGKDIFLVCDPPFGGRVEFISQTMKSITDSHRILNEIKDESPFLKIFFIFPYFMESIMQNKSNPRGVDGGLKELKMSDYKVDYDNHPLFVTGSSGRKFGSPVRIFTNIPLNSLKLPEESYRYCRRCDKWISNENKHCKLCKSCTSKDGRRYRHCKICQRCVKPTWKHCNVCERCVLEKHNCGSRPKITGECFKCSGTDHIAKDCPGIKLEKRKRESHEPMKKKKRKLQNISASGDIKNTPPIKQVEKLKEKNNDVSHKKIKKNVSNGKEQKIIGIKSKINQKKGKLMSKPKSVKIKNGK